MALGFAAILGLASTVASAAGTLAGAGGKDGPRPPQPTGYEGIPALYATAGHKFDAMSLRQQAISVEGNARLSNMFTDYNAKMQQLDLERQGDFDQRSGQFEEKQLDRKANFDFAVGQRNMFEVQEDAKLVASEFKARASASGFIPTMGDLDAEAGRIDAEGKYQSRLALNAAEVARDTSRIGADVARAQGDYAKEYADWQAGVVGGASKLTQMINTMGAQREAFALKFAAKGSMLAASGSRQAGKAAIHAANVTASQPVQKAPSRLPSLLGAGATLLGGAQKFQEETKFFGGK